MPLQPVRPGADDRALLYSLAEFREVILAVLDITATATVVEVGSEQGTFAEELIAWVDARGGRMISIDPVPADAVRVLAAAHAAMELHETTSIDALSQLDAADAYLLDGDHNHFTVSNELRLIDEAARRDGKTPVVLAQDWSWPAGWRDQYYEPETLPAGAAQPWSYAGVVPWDSRTVNGGFRGDGHFAFAEQEGGEGNGVATAIDDFMAAHQGWSMRTLPCIFGLAVLYPGDAPWAGALDAYLAPLDDHPLLRRLEANRLWLYLRLIEVQDRLAEEGRHHRDERAALQSVIETQRSTIEALRLERSPT